MKLKPDISFNYNYKSIKFHDIEFLILWALGYRGMILVFGRSSLFHGLHSAGQNSKQSV